MKATPMIETMSTGRRLVSERLDVRFDEWTHKLTSALAPHIGQNDTLLECGCGDGRVLAALPGRLKAGVESCQAAARLAIGAGLDVRPTIEDFAGAQFSRIVYSAGLEIATIPADSLANVRSFLTKEGLLLLSQPVSGGTLGPGSWRAQSELRSQFARLLINAGFEPREIAFQRRTYHSAGFQLTVDGSADQTSNQKTYWIVRPFLALTAVAGARQ